MSFKTYVTSQNVNVKIQRLTAVNCQSINLSSSETLRKAEKEKWREVFIRCVIILLIPLLSCCYSRNFLETKQYDKKVYNFGRWSNNHGEEYENYKSKFVFTCTFTPVTKSTRILEIILLVVIWFGIFFSVHWFTSNDCTKNLPYPFRDSHWW